MGRVGLHLHGLLSRGVLIPGKCQVNTARYYNAKISSQSLAHVGAVGEVPG